MLHGRTRVVSGARQRRSRMRHGTACEAPRLSDPTVAAGIFGPLKAVGKIRTKGVYPVQQKRSGKEFRSIADKVRCDIAADSRSPPLPRPRVGRASRRRAGIVRLTTAESITSKTLVN